MLTNEMSQPLRTACEAIYSEFRGYWPNDSECARLQCAIDAALRAERTRTETLRAALEVVKDTGALWWGGGLRDDRERIADQVNAALAASVEEPK